MLCSFSRKIAEKQNCQTFKLPFILLLSEKIENEEIKIKPNSGWQNNS
jgi:hypothetical protein